MTGEVSVGLKIIVHKHYRKRSVLLDGREFVNQVIGSLIFGGMFKAPSVVFNFLFAKG